LSTAARGSNVAGGVLPLPVPTALPCCAGVGWVASAGGPRGPHRFGAVVWKIARSEEEVAIRDIVDGVPRRAPYG